MVVPENLPKQMLFNGFSRLQGADNRATHNHNVHMRARKHTYHMFKTDDESMNLLRSDEWLDGTKGDFALDSLEVRP